MACINVYRMLYCSRILLPLQHNTESLYSVNKTVKLLFSCTFLYQICSPLLWFRLHLYTLLKHHSQFTFAHYSIYLTFSLENMGFVSKKILFNIQTAWKILWNPFNFLKLQNKPSEPKCTWKIWIYQQSKDLSLSVPQKKCLISKHQFPQL
jgi:hypothetical protein